MLDKYKFDILCSFETVEQVRISLEADSSTSEELFFIYIFNRLSDVELNDIYKISICQYCDNENDVLPFVTDCSGKIYFHETHGISQRVKNYRDEYLSLMHIPNYVN